MLRRFSISFAVFSMAIDYLIAIASMVAMTVLRPGLSSLSFVQPMSDIVWLPPVIYIVFPLLWVIIYSILSIYDGRRYLKVADELAGVTLGSIIATISMAGILYLSVRDVSRAFFLSFAIISFLLCVAWRLIARGIFRLRKTQSNQSRHILVAGERKISTQVLKNLSTNGSDMIFTIRHFNPNSTTGIYEWIVELKQTITQDNITDLVVAVSYDQMSTMTAIMPELDDQAVNIWVAMDFMDLSFSDTRVENFSGIPVLDLRAPALSEFDQLVKRIFDLVFGTIALIISSPIMLVVSLLILLFDGSPVFFHQQRVGENGRTFKMHKFRTMVRNAEKQQDAVGYDDEEGNHVYKVREDPRVSRLGRVLRRLSLDELPQLINVIKGEMSIVGPRPELPHLVKGYERWQRKRLTVPPGITGWWQVTGRADKAMHLHTEDDLYYVQNYSLWLDIRIIIRTLYVVLVGKGSY